MSTNNPTYKDEDFLNYKEAGLVLGFDEETAENGVKRLIREHNLPYTELSPNNIKFQYCDLKEYIKSKKVNVPKVEETKDESIEALKLAQEKAKILQDTEKDKVEFDASMLEANLRLKLAKENIAKVEDIEHLRTQYENLISVSKTDYEYLNKREKDLVERENKVKEQNTRYQEYLKREHQIGERENAVFLKEQHFDDIEAQHNIIVNQKNEEIRCLTETNSRLGILISNIKSDTTILKCAKCGQLKKHPDCDLANLIKPETDS